VHARARACVCVRARARVHQRQWGKTYNHIIYEDKKIMQNFSCKYQKEKYHLQYFKQLEDYF